MYLIFLVEYLTITAYFRFNTKENERRATASIMKRNGLKGKQKNHIADVLLRSYTRTITFGFAEKAHEPMHESPTELQLISTFEKQYCIELNLVNWKIWHIITKLKSNPTLKLN